MLHHDKPPVVRERLGEMLALMVSSRPASTLTASYLARLLLAAPALPWVLADRLGLLRASQYNTTLLMILLVRWETKVLEGHIAGVTKTRTSQN